MKKHLGATWCTHAEQPISHAELPMYILGATVHTRAATYPEEASGCNLVHTQSMPISHADATHDNQSRRNGAHTQSRATHPDEAISAQILAITTPNARHCTHAARCSACVHRCAEMLSLVHRNHNTSQLPIPYRTAMTNANTSQCSREQQYRSKL